MSASQCVGGSADAAANSGSAWTYWRPPIAPSIDRTRDFAPEDFAQLEDDASGCLGHRNAPAHARRSATNVISCGSNLTSQKFVSVSINSKS
jgi:hypothetical protein